MGYILLIILWGLVGWVYLINLAGSEASDEMSDWQMALIYAIFLPTTLSAYIIILAIEFTKEIKKWKKKKSGKTLKDMRDYIK